MRNETTPPPDLQPPQNLNPSDTTTQPDLLESFPASHPNDPQKPNEGTEFYPDDILDEDPELGSPAGVANEPPEVDLLETVAEIKPNSYPDEKSAPN